MKKFYSLFIGLTTFVSSVQAADFQVGNFFFNVISESAATCALTEPVGDKYTGDVVIPGTVEYDGRTWTVTEIGNRSFYYASGVTSLTLPNTVVSMRRGCITGCNSMTTMTLSENLEYIDTMAVSTCNKITELVLPPKLKRLSFRALSLANITSINIPASLTTIELTPFYSCSKLQRLDVDPANPVYSSANGFLLSKDGSCLIMNLPGNKVSSLETMPETVTEIAPWAFYNASASITSVIIPDRVTKIGEWSFGECRKASELYIGKGITEIPAFAFGWFSACAKLTMGENVTTIGDNAFESYGSSMYSKAPQTLTISSKIKHIGKEAFTMSGFNELIISEGVECIDTLAFSGMNYVAKMTLPKSLKEIKMLGFQSIPKLTEIEFPDALTSIGDGAFAGCSKLTGVRLSANVTTVGKRAFSKCTALKSIEVAEANPAFASVGGLLLTKDKKMLKQYPVGLIDTLYVVPSYITQLEGGAFAGSGYLREVRIHDNVDYVGVGIFQECSALRRATLPSNMTVLPEGSFMNCTQLRTIELPKNLVEIGPQAFYFCQALTEVTLPATLKRLGNFAFEMGRYVALKNVYAESVTPPTCTYNGYDGLATFNATITGMGTLHVPQGSAQAYRDAAMWCYFKNIVEEVTTGVDAIPADGNNDIRVIADGGVIAVDAAEGTPVVIYSVAGANVWSGVAPASVVAPSQGIYIVKAGTKTVKVGL